MTPIPAPSTTRGRRGAGLSVLGGGVMIGLLEVAFIVSFASLIFASSPPSDFARGLGFLLVGGAVLNLIGARWSSLPGAVLMPQDATTAIVAATAGTLLATVDSGLGFESIVLYLAMCSAITGLVMLFLGVVRKGRLVRFIPVPVIGGFLAGTGYLLLVGGVEIASGGFDFQGSSLAASIGAGAFALGLVVWLRRRPGLVVVPAALGAGVVAFFVILWVTGTSLEEARNLGLLPGSAESVIGLPLEAFRNADLSILRSGIGGLLTVPLVATLGMLLNVSALEMISESDADLDRELRGAGVANLAASLGGGVAGYHGLGLTTLGYRMGVMSRLVPAIAALVCLAAWLAGGALMALVPVPLVAAVLMFLGLSFLSDWLVDARKQMTGPEVLLMVALVVAVATIGFIAAVALGMVAAVLMFVVAYGRLDPIRHSSTGSEIRSSVDRAPSLERTLSERAGSILVVELQGYLFFGSSNTVVDRVTEAMGSIPDPRCVVIDLRHVDGADTTSVAAVTKLARAAGRRQCLFLVSQVPASLEDELSDVLSAHPNASIVSDLDHALELAEDSLLGDSTGTSGGGLSEVFGEDGWRELRPHLRSRVFEPGETVIDFGDDSKGVLLVAEGRIETEIPTSGGWRRVRSSGPGTIVGEVSVYREGGRTARVVATEPSLLFELDAEAITALERSDPPLALALHRTLASVLADRVAATNAAVASLLR